MKKLILISGKAEHGKTTFANFLKSELESKGQKVVVSNYAYYLKDISKRYFGWNGEKDKVGRELLQVLGTDIVRKKLNKPNFHVQRVCEDIEIAKDNVDFVIIDDTRFPNEIYYPKAIFGDKVITVKVVRVNEDGSSYSNSLSEEQRQHPSETALDNFDFEVVATAVTADQLKAMAKEFVEN